MVKYHEIGKAYGELRNAVHTSNKLDDKKRALIKLAVSTGVRLEGAVHSHTHKVLETGCNYEEIKQTVLLSLPAIGRPSMMVGLSWVDDVLKDKSK